MIFFWYIFRVSQFVPVYIPRMKLRLLSRVECWKTLALVFLLVSETNDRIFFLGPSKKVWRDSFFSAKICCQLQKHFFILTNTISHPTEKKNKNMWQERKKNEKQQIRREQTFVTAYDITRFDLSIEFSQFTLTAFSSHFHATKPNAMVIIWLWFSHFTFSTFVFIFFLLVSTLLNSIRRWKMKMLKINAPDEGSPTFFFFIFSRDEYQTIVMRIFVCVQDISPLWHKYLFKHEKELKS